jgi:hypothetical protein
MPSLPGPMRVWRGLGHPLVPPILLALWLGVIFGVSSWPDSPPWLVTGGGWPPRRTWASMGGWGSFSSGTWSAGFPAPAL